MLSQSVYTLVNQQNGNLAFKLFEFDNNSYFDHIQRNNYFTLILITGGEGIAKVDFFDYSFKEDIICFLSLSAIYADVKGMSQRDRYSVSS